MPEKMRILVVHNRYQQAGGEDSVVRAEVSLLRSKGHEVDVLEEDNDSIVGWGASVKTSLQCIYSFSEARKVQERIRRFKPDLAHIHNFFPRLSPSVHSACYAAKIPVVQTLHNYRLLCPAATFLRDGKVCEDCLGKTIPWPAVQHGCYRQNRLASAAVANMLAVHRAFGTWSRTVSRYIALTQFSRDKFIAGGWPGDKIAVKPNFVDPDPGMGTGNGDYALFVGRLSEEKGIRTLLDAWSLLSTSHRLKIVGEGPLAPLVKDASAMGSGIEWLGGRSKDEVLALMANATFLIFPSTWYETFGLVIIEAFSVGLPVIASRLGAMAELVSDGETGLLFTPGRSDDLAAAIEWAFSHSGQLQAMRLRARCEFEKEYTKNANYETLVEIYKSTLNSCNTQ